MFFFCFFLGFGWNDGMFILFGYRQICERWMAWEPSKRAWGTYINMELRHNETEQVRKIYERYVKVHPEPKTWIKFAKVCIFYFSFPNPYNLNCIIRTV